MSLLHDQCRVEGFVFALNPTINWTPDESQRAIIDLNEGSHLVLAPPGCGKTQSLAERIAVALNNGVKSEDMLCLTFTNRAARSMRERVGERIGEDKAEDVFVGNVHRYCARFLFENGIVPAVTAIIDDDTANSILARYLNEDETTVTTNFKRKRAYQQIIFFSHLMYDIRHGVPKALRIHPECVTPEDVAMMKRIAAIQHRPFDAALMLDIYDHTEFYLDVVRQPPFTPLLQHEAVECLMKWRYAHAYTAYKRQNNLIDFEDLLQLAYTALQSNPDYKRYSWIQVDEVQDLNFLQLALIDSLTDHRPEAHACSIYFGDEQQAIFSFMGAKMETLNLLKEKCKGNIRHLGVNHRSPEQLVSMLNTFAVSNLDSDPQLLPTTDGAGVDKPCELRVCRTENIWSEYKSVTKRAAKLLKDHPKETTAIVVSANRDADEISNVLTQQHIAHFKVSGTDIFSTPSVRLLLAHVGVLNNVHNFIAWSNLMYGLKVCGTAATSRQFVSELRRMGILPSDAFSHDGKTTLQRFIDIYNNKDIIVFDTETTGLNVFEDDVIQIAAERLHQGKVVGSFSVYIETDRPIPKMLGDIVNPIIAEREHQPIVGHAEAIRQFLDFAEGGVLLAHNAAYDYHIMDFNLRRYLPEVDWQQRCPQCLDSLQLIRLLRYDLKVFKLKSLLAELGLSGENSHLADDDVNATVQLVNFCYVQGKAMVERQQVYLEKPQTVKRMNRLRQVYGEIYEQGRGRLYERLPIEESTDSKPALVTELTLFYQYLIDNHLAEPVDKIDYIFRFLQHDVIDAVVEPSLYEQLCNHAIELSTFRESDLCGSSTMSDRLVVSTIHKAKGLEFDNVLVFDVTDNRFPIYVHEGNAKMMAEDARKLYVAMSRSRRRLFVYYHTSGSNPGAPPCKLSRFMQPVAGYFGPTCHGKP